MHVTRTFAAFNTIKHSLKNPRHVQMTAIQQWQAAISGRFRCHVILKGCVPSEQHSVDWSQHSLLVPGMAGAACQLLRRQASSTTCNSMLLKSCSTVILQICQQAQGNEITAHLYRSEFHVGRILYRVGTSRNVRTHWAFRFTGASASSAGAIR